MPDESEILVSVNQTKALNDFSKLSDKIEAIEKVITKDLNKAFTASGTDATKAYKKAGDAIDQGIKRGTGRARDHTGRFVKDTEKELGGNRFFRVFNRIGERMGKSLFSGMNRTVKAGAGGLQGGVLRALRFSGRGAATLGGALGGVGAPFGLVGGAGVVGAGAAFGAAIYKGAEFDDQLARAAAISEDIQKNRDLVADVAKELGANTAFTGTESLGGIRSLTQAGVKLKDTLTVIPSALDLAAVSEEGVAESASLAAAVMSSFLLKAKQLPAVMDQLALGSTKFNTTLPVLGKSMSRISTGIVELKQDTATATTIMGAMIDLMPNTPEVAATGLLQLMRRLTGATQQFEHVFEATGTTLQDVKTGNIDLLDFLADLSGAVDDGSVSMDTLNKMFEIEGATAFKTFRNALKGGQKNLFDIREELRESEGALGKMVAIIKDTLKGAFVELGSAIDAVALSLVGAGGKGVNNSLKKFLKETVTPTVQQFSRFVELRGGIVGLVSDMWRIAGEFFPALSNFVVGVFDATWKEVKTGFKNALMDIDFGSQSLGEFLGFKREDSTFSGDIDAALGSLKRSVPTLDEWVAIWKRAESSITDTKKRTEELKDETSDMARGSKPAIEAMRKGLGGVWTEFSKGAQSALQAMPALFSKTDPDGARVLGALQTFGQSMAQSLQSSLSGAFQGLLFGGVNDDTEQALELLRVLRNEVEQTGTNANTNSLFEELGNLNVGGENFLTSPLELAIAKGTGSGLSAIDTIIKQLESTQSFVGRFKTFFSNVIGGLKPTFEQGVGNILATMTISKGAEFLGILKTSIFGDDGAKAEAVLKPALVESMDWALEGINEEDYTVTLSDLGVEVKAPKTNGVVTSIQEALRELALPATAFLWGDAIGVESTTGKALLAFGVFAMQTLANDLTKEKASGVIGPRVLDAVKGLDLRAGAFSLFLSFAASPMAGVLAGYGAMTFTAIETSIKNAKLAEKIPEAIQEQLKDLDDEGANSSSQTGLFGMFKPLADLGKTVGQSFGELWGEGFGDALKTGGSAFTVVMAATNNIAASVVAGVGGALGSTISTAIGGVGGAIAGAGVTSLFGILSATSSQDIAKDQARRNALYGTDSSSLVNFLKAGRVSLGVGNSFGLETGGQFQSAIFDTLTNRLNAIHDSLINVTSVLNDPTSGDIDKGFAKDALTAAISRSTFDFGSFDVSTGGGLLDIIKKFSELRNFVSQLGISTGFAVTPTGGTGPDGQPAGSVNGHASPYGPSSKPALSEFQQVMDVWGGIQTTLNDIKTNTFALSNMRDSLAIISNDTTQYYSRINDIGTNTWWTAAHLYAMRKMDQSRNGSLGLPGYATGGSFMVGGRGGVDRNVVAFRATNNERVTIETPEQQRNSGGVVLESGAVVVQVNGSMSVREIEQKIVPAVIKATKKLGARRKTTTLDSGIGKRRTT